MKKYLRFIVVVLTTFILSNCSDSKKDEPDNPTQNDEYYVKYEASVSSVYQTNDIQYTVNTENGSQTFTSGKSFSETFGPVRKGFNASISADANNLYITECFVKIYVSRNDEPFVLKANNSGDRSASASYSIDY